MKDAAEIRSSVQRVAASLVQRPPEAKPDVPARAVWQGGLTVQLVADQPQALLTDMPVPLGGEDRAPSPGWYLRRLEVEARSESDPRGLLGCADGVPPGPQQVRMEVVIEADGADAQALQDLVAYADAHAPMSGALRRPLQVSSTIRTKDTQPLAA